ncbi:hypothetical protein DAEQUDRAFT_354504 [Daedalea quercina L-15889]|uniref:Uncharacterized protein n=1 Tax=Daedalea quercina L-15889 TaxID=1314783 RepID=A0A165TQM7_9APHY|nr:hypothetical protein DAEQUDRAFT_354504 [Daedalea quercina L-15889]
MARRSTRTGELRASRRVIWPETRRARYGWMDAGEALGCRRRPRAGAGSRSHQTRGSAAHSQPPRPRPRPSATGHRSSRRPRWARRSVRPTACLLSIYLRWTHNHHPCICRAARACLLPAAAPLVLDTVTSSERARNMRQTHVCRGGNSLLLAHRSRLFPAPPSPSPSQTCCLFERSSSTSPTRQLATCSNLNCQPVPSQQINSATSQT